MALNIKVFMEATFNLSLILFESYGLKPEEEGEVPIGITRKSQEILKEKNLGEGYEGKVICGIVTYNHYIFSYGQCKHYRHYEGAICYKIKRY